MGCSELISKTWGDLLSVGKDDKLILLPFEFILLASLKRGCFAVATGGNWHEWNIDHWLFTWSWDYNKYFHFTIRKKTSNLSSFHLPTIDWTLETKPRRDKMSDLPFSIKNILSGNIGKKEHLQWHFCPLFSRCPWSYVPRIQLSSPSSKKMKKVKRSVFSKDQIAKLEKSFHKRVREAFQKEGPSFLQQGLILIICKGDPLRNYFLW